MPFLGVVDSLAEVPNQQQTTLSALHLKANKHPRVTSVRYGPVHHAAQRPGLHQQRRSSTLPPCGVQQHRVGRGRAPASDMLRCALRLPCR